MEKINYKYLMLFVCLYCQALFSQTVTWTGNTDNDWHKACNWDLNLIPTCSHTVVIPSVSVYPVVTDIAHCSILNITSMAANALTINSSGSGVLYIASLNGGVCSGVAKDNGGCGPSCGAQAWATANLNTGTMINSSSGGQLQTNNGINEKYCYNNIAANCATYGGLYEWAEVMRYTASINCDPCGSGGRQGMCPVGYHIPTDLEWSRYEHCLENNIAPTGSTALVTFQTNTGFRGENSLAASGYKMKAVSPTWNGSDVSGFSALPAGHRAISDGAFAALGMGTDFWSATETSAANAWHRRLGSFTVYSARYEVTKTYGFSVRCLKN